MRVHSLCPGGQRPIPPSCRKSPNEEDVISHDVDEIPAAVRCGRGIFVGWIGKICA